MTNMKKRIAKITNCYSMSGNAGCNNGNYDIPVHILYTDRTVETVYTCACGQGCSNSFPANYLRVGMSYKDVCDVARMWDEDADEDNTDYHDWEEFDDSLD